MNFIVASFRPFTLNQNISVYINDECVKTMRVSTSKVVETINGLISEYDIHQIDLCGNRSYLSKFKAEMMTKFSNNDCIINIIER